MILPPKAIKPRKQCNVCKKHLEYHFFYVNNKRYKDKVYNYLAATCRLCGGAIAAEWRRNNPDKVREYNRRKVERERLIRQKQRENGQ